ncbi:MAG: two-component system, OmpR family, sensor histidine kinase KdpD [Sphingomonadales bacterium]|nr:two-component system, OmpR family, sensor histidine kinase KdpD [Sphingomonadales bacterium]
MPPQQRGIAGIADGVRAYTGTLAMVAVSTLLGLWIAPRWGTAPVDMIYLPAVLGAAALWGLGPGVVAGITAALAYNFFFTAPVHTLQIDRFADVVTVIVLLIVALVTGRLAAGIRKQAQIADAHAARNAVIAGFARRLLSCSTEDEIARVTCEELRRLFDCNAVVVSGLPTPEVIAMVPDGNRLTPSDVAAAVLAIESAEPAGRGTGSVQPAEWAFYPIRSGDAVLAAAGLARDDGAPAVGPHNLELLTSLLDQVALALERAQLESEARDFAATRERDRLRAALLSSIGQDLRPRLTAIGAAVRELKRSGSGDRQLISTIGNETSQLDRYIANLVELGEAPDEQPIEAGGVTIDLLHRRVSKDGEPVRLTPKEFAVLAELAKHRGRVLSHPHLLRTVWGPAQENQTDYLRVAIRALRQKLETEPSRPQLIINEPGVGYRLSA